MKQMRCLAIIFLIIISIAPTAAHSQKVKLEIVLPPTVERTTVAPSIRSNNLIIDREMSDLLRNGFPARLHYKLERWADGRFFDDIKATLEWDVVVKLDQLSKQYQVVRIVRDKPVSLGEFETLNEAEQALDKLFRAPISTPKRGQKSYYNLTLDVEILSLNDLDELERWLRGELKPAVRGKKNPGTAVSRGLSTLVVRLLGGEKRNYETRSGTFTP
jgi:hypothetical protein